MSLLADPKSASGAASDPDSAELRSAAGRSSSAREAEALWVSERFVSLQGEGITTGAPAGFLRLARCNLACGYCDTPYSWDFSNYRFEDEVVRTSFDELAEWVRAHCPGRLIVTGGEPLLQHKALGQLLCRLESEDCLPIVEVETNGTITPSDPLSARVAQWNVSIKLASSGEPLARRHKPRVIAWFSAQPRAYFKFVVQDAQDREEALRLADAFGIAKTRILFMPQARSAAELAERSVEVAGHALASGVRFSSRLHLQLYGGRRGF